jgi:hypothetical protein
MNEIIEKYEAKLDYLNKSVDSYSHLMDENTLEMMEDLKLLLTEVIVDFKIIDEKFNDFLQKEHELGISDKATIERIQWYYDTYFAIDKIKGGGE